MNDHSIRHLPNRNILQPLAAGWVDHADVVGIPVGNIDSIRVRMIRDAIGPIGAGERNGLDCGHGGRIQHAQRVALMVADKSPMVRRIKGNSMWMAAGWKLNSG